MAHHDLLVLGGVGMLALACLVVCGIYVYWISERHRNRLRRIEPRTASAGHINEEDDLLSGDDTTMGTQLSHRCKTSLYRAVFGNLHDESTVFLIAASRDDARKRATDALAAIHGVAAKDVALRNLASFRELIDIGVSEDEDVRIFELAWKGADVSAWAEHPLFLTDDPSLLGKWAELYADLARELAISAIDRARS
jgi:threonine dehydrogenase-like Zn-dependent dehydrogenase